jgi:hypothetical protein
MTHSSGLAFERSLRRDDRSNWQVPRSQTQNCEPGEAPRHGFGTTITIRNVDSITYRSFKGLKCRIGPEKTSTRTQLVHRISILPMRSWTRFQRARLRRLGELAPSQSFFHRLVDRDRHGSNGMELVSTFTSASPRPPEILSGCVGRYRRQWETPRERGGCFAARFRVNINSAREDLAGIILAGGLRFHSGSPRSSYSLMGAFTPVSESIRARAHRSLSRANSARQLEAAGSQAVDLKKMASRPRTTAPA